MDGKKTLVSRDDLADFMRLFRTCAGLFETYGDESLAVECEQTAEMIEGYYLPYNEQGVYIADGA